MILFSFLVESFMTMPKQSRRKGSNNSQTTKSSKALSCRRTRRTSTMTENEHSGRQTPVSTTVTTQHAVLPVSSSGPSDDFRTLTLNDVSVIVQQVIKSLPHSFRVSKQLCQSNLRPPRFLRANQCLLLHKRLHPRP